MYLLPFLNPLIRDILYCVFVDSFSVEIKTQCCRDLFVSGVRRHRNPISFPFQVFNNALDGKTNRQTNRQTKERKLFDRCNAFYWKWSKRCLGQTICVVLCAYRNRKSKRRNKSKSKSLSLEVSTVKSNRDWDQLFFSCWEKLFRTVDYFSTVKTWLWITTN